MTVDEIRALRLMGNRDVFRRGKLGRLRRLNRSELEILRLLGLLERKGLVSSEFRWKGPAQVDREWRLTPEGIAAKRVIYRIQDREAKLARKGRGSGGKVFSETMPESAD
jgi:hypothetical protein